ncbi:hypothetical protein APHAL10511_001588 [Amanita phalloides]|nr:hypothetical protein APHAL10511_001588 [Amanita phalloides]
MSSNQDPMYTMTNSQNGMFPNMIHSSNFDSIPLEMDPSKHQLSNAAKLSGYDTNTFRSVPSFPNPLRQRHYPNNSVVNPQLRDNYYQNPTPDMLGITSPLQSHASLAFEFGAGQSGGNFKQFHEAFGHAQPALPLATLNGKNNVSQHNKTFAAHYSNVQLTSQTPFGPHIPLNMPSHIPNGLSNIGSTNPSQNTPNPAATSGNSAVSGQEEICTIFVVGFPDDMQEREFQNMFTFSQGFEAATLKIPNKDSTTYAGNPGRVYGGSNDPFNLVVDRDGTSSWAGAASGDESSGATQFSNNGNAPPRKQIIGFAKFRTRQDALAAKDHLQGKRIDMEKGAILKAEMAKKNLHTKRGVGAVPSNNAVSSVSIGTGMGNYGVYQPSVLSGLTNGLDAYPVNDSMSTPGSLGLNRVNPSLVREPNMGVLRERDEEDARRRENVMGFGTLPTRSARIDDDERERRREEFRQRSGAAGFDPFNSYGPQAYSEAMRPPLGISGSNHGLYRSGELNGHMGIHDETVGPWDSVTATSAQLTPARSASPLHGENATLAVERQISSGSISPGVVNGSQCDSFIDSSAIEAEIAKSLNGLSLSTATGDISPQLPSPASNASSTGGRVIDQNPPINTLYVGNLPTGIVEQLEEKLRELFSAQSGYRRLCFRQKNNGPMCFVEFEDVNFATKALHNLQGHTLNGLIKGTGIRLSYSKNPLGVRTPTSTGGGQLQQQQSHPAVDPLPSRPSDDPLQPKPSVVRRDVNLVNPTSSSGTGNGTHSAYGNSFLASPPPRFFSSSPSALTPFSAAASSQPVSGLFPRNSAANILNLYNPPSFAPFGFTSMSQPMIPDHHLTSQDEQTSANPYNVQQHFHRVMSPPVANVEAARAS